MKTIKRGVLMAVLGCTFLTSCTQDETIEKNAVEVDIAQSVLQLPEDVKEAIIARGEDPSDFQYTESMDFTGNLQKLIITGEDIAIDKDEFLKLYNAPTDSKQYQTTFLIDTNVFQTINVLAFTGSEPAGFGLTPEAVAGLQRAIANWNAVQLTTINLELTTTNNPQFDPNVFEVAVSANPALGGFGGRAQFPRSDNSPGNFVEISPNANQFAGQNQNAIEHLLTHELGHTLGFRHTDWDTRASCVRAGLASQEQSEAPAQLILGTPSTFFNQFINQDSIMNACFITNEVSGEINFIDAVALRKLYPR